MAAQVDADMEDEINAEIAQEYINSNGEYDKAKLLEEHKNNANKATKARLKKKRERVKKSMIVVAGVLKRQPTNKTKQMEEIIATLKTQVGSPELIDEIQKNNHPTEITTHRTESGKQ